MSKVYSKAPDEAVERLDRVLEAYCPDLKNAGVRVDLVSVSTDDPDEPALKLAGYACAAVVRIVGAKDRAKGNGDAEIVIDEHVFTDLPEATKDALLHHELYHLEIIKNRHGRVTLDDQGRPKLKMRLHDRQFGWFDEIARIHGKDSMEIRQSSTFVMQAKQLYFFYALEEGFVPEDTQTELLASDRTSVTVKVGAKTVFMSEQPVTDAETQALYNQAVAIVRDTKRASTAMIQRRLRIGYNRAATLMDLMEKRGIVGPENGSSPREILEPVEA